MSLKCLFFDAAGTLIEPTEPVGHTYARFAARYGVETDAAAVMQAFRTVWKQKATPVRPEGQAAGDDDRGWWREVVAEVFAHVQGLPLPEQTLEPLFDELYGHFALPEAWRVYPEVVPALEALKGCYDMLVLSNFDRRLLSILDGHGLSGYFRRVLLSSEVGASKPHPRMFQAALGVAGCEPQACVHVGDDRKCDIEGARQAGIGYFAVERPGAGLDVLVKKVQSGEYSSLHMAQE